MATNELKPFDMSTIQPFYPAADESTLANVSLRLPENRRMLRRQRQRSTRVLNKHRAAVQTIEKLPAPDESLHCVLNGSFALADFIGAVLELSGRPLDHLAIVTLGFSKANVESLDQLITASQVKRLDILCSHYFAAADAQIFAQAAALCSKHGFRIAAMRTHAKILLLKTGAHSIVVESSASLRSCHNVETATMFNDAGLFDFHRAWIDELLTKGVAK